MNENKTCNICRDLIPLVQDGVASPESEELVSNHIAECEECKALFGGAPADKAPENPPVTKGLKSAKRYLTVIYSCLMLLGLYVGLSLTGGEDLFVNTLIMPVAGALGYLAFRLRALYIVPALLLVISFIANALGLFAERADLIDLLLMAFIYFLFALGGIIVAMLYKFAIFGINKGAK
ncbi:MAG: zf-HC2 domain-containing protein [Oscillospiraceae bacterium]|nr:zf-HC2 domain-containing protein [Oscillospiraceae bacterium]